MKKTILLAAGSILCMHVMAQDQPVKEAPKISFSGYVEAYYSFDLNEPADHLRPGFLYNHNRHNELNVNLAYLKGSYASDRVRANLSIMAGTYAQYNLAAESELMRHIYEANVGLCVGKNVWVDAGIMPSHIGFESAITKDNMTLSRSLGAENSPYYEAGAKITWTPNEKWTLAAMYLNGWQRIKRVNGNQTPGFGTQITFKPSSKVTLNWSTFVGNDKPDSVRQMRYFNDVYGIFNITDKFSLIAGFDYGLEQKEKGKSDLNNWYTPVLMAKYAFTDKIALAGRYEYYNDENGVIIATGTPNGFKTSGYSLNFDVAPVSNVLFRLEGKLYNSKNDIFVKNTEVKNSNVALTASLAVSF
ncbi:porin [Chitinophaga niabensis]|uniref:porin n=1 Tax=Chitinophaga niabensis TaxID=536979 RepID=UPI0031BA1CFA